MVLLIAAVTVVLTCFLLIPLQAVRVVAEVMIAVVELLKRPLHRMDQWTNKLTEPTAAR